MKLIKQQTHTKKYFLITSRPYTIHIVLIKYIETLLSKTQNVYQYNNIIIVKRL